MAITKASVLVTGAGGFIGSEVVRHLVHSLREGGVRLWDGVPVGSVVALLRREGPTERLSEIADGELCRFEYADLTDRTSLHEVLRRVSPRAVLHVALDRSAYQPMPDAERVARHIAPVEELFRGLSLVPGARFIHTGSAWVLPAGVNLDEGVDPEPRSPYAATKLQIDQLLPRLQQETGVKWLNLRLFNTFGKWERADRLLPYLVRQLSRGEAAKLSAGDLIRDFNDVVDVARAYELALQAPDAACGQVYHIGSGRGTSVREFALTVAEVAGRAHLIRFGAIATPDEDLPVLVANSDRAQRVLGWMPQTEPRERIISSAAWWLRRMIGDGHVPEPVDRVGSRFREASDSRS